MKFIAPTKTLLRSLLFACLSISFAISAKAALIIPKAPSLQATAYLLMDANSGQVLVEKNPDKRIPPASLTKMMTSYVAVHEIMMGNIQKDDKVLVSVNAWKRGGSRMFIREGTEVSIMDLLRGVIIQSGNDASVALAEHIAGSEESFAGLMNQYAQRFGLGNTNFINATGLPDKNHYSSARDLAVLARHIIQDHPDYYGLYAEKYFKYNDIRQPNRNKLLWRNPNVDGLKTGHTEEAGFCLTASAKKEGMRLIAVVMGTNSTATRAVEAQKLFNYGFRFYETHELYKAGDKLQTVDIWKGKENTLDVILPEGVSLTLPRGGKEKLKAKIKIDKYITAPVKEGQKLGQLSIELNGEVMATKKLVAKNAIAKSGFFSRLWDGILMFFTQIFSS